MRWIPGVLLIGLFATSLYFGWQHPVGLLLVLFGTALGVLQSFPMPVLMSTMRIAWTPIVYCPIDTLSEWLLAVQEQVRREGVLSLEPAVESAPYPLLRKGLSYLVDQRPPEWIRHQLSQTSDHHINQLQDSAAVWETAAGLSPTMGILGALASLMLTGGHLKTADVAPAFTATFLGVGLANLVFLPLANQLRHQAEHCQALDQKWIDGLISIQSGEHRLILLDRLYPEQEIMPVV